MKVECSIGLEPFQSSEAIASGKCGHVSSTKHASHAGLTRLSAVSHRNEQDGLHLTRLFFTQSSTSRDTLNQRDIDELQASPIAGLEAKVKTLKLNSATSEETNAALTMLNRQHAAAAIRRY